MSIILVEGVFYTENLWDFFNHLNPNESYPGYDFL